MGLLSDHFSPWPLATITLSCCSLATFILWGVAGYAVAGILVYGTCFGILAGGFSSLYTGFVKPIASESCLTYATFILINARRRGRHLAFRSAVRLPSVQQRARKRTVDPNINGFVGLHAHYRTPKNWIRCRWWEVREDDYIRGLMSCWCGCCGAWRMDERENRSMMSRECLLVRCGVPAERVASHPPVETSMRRCRSNTPTS